MKDFSAKGFSEYVGGVSFSRTIFDSDILFLLNPFANIMIGPLDMFSVRVVTNILSKYERGVVISINDGRICLGAAGIGKELPEPNSLPHSVAKAEVLSLNGGVGDDWLPLATPADRSVAEIEDIA